MHSTATEPQEAALFLPLNHGDLMASLKDHKSVLPNCYPSSTFALSTLTFRHTSLEKPESILHKKFDIAIMFQGLINMSKILS